MILSRRSLCFLLEAPQPVLVLHEIRRQHFDRHITIKACVMSKVNLTHSARPDLGNNTIVPDRRADLYSFAHVFLSPTS